MIFLLTQKKNPRGVYWDDDVPREDKKWLTDTKTIKTRGQKIESIDNFDYGKEYPGSWVLQSVEETANDILKKDKFLTSEDARALSEIKDIKEKTKYIENKIKEQRSIVEKDRLERSFDNCMNDCYTAIKKYMEKSFGPEVAKLSVLPDKKRIHLVADYDYKSIAGSGSSWVFRSNAGDIYVSQKFLKQFVNKAAIGKTPTSSFPRMYREIKHVLTHELIHSMSVINYKELNRKTWWTPLTATRRLGLRNMNYNINKKTSRWVGINEWTTEHITQLILKQLYNEEWLIDYVAPRTSYEEEQEIMEAVIKNNWNIKREDFYKAQLLRKYGDEKDIKGPTPLVELLRKMNEGKELNTAKKPYYYQIIMDLTDYVNENNIVKGDEVLNIISKFVETGNINLIKNHFWAVILKEIFDPSLLNRTKTNFNDTILNIYK